jgi:hypothetical protein
MTGRTDPEHKHEARRAAIRERLITDGKDPVVANRWCDAWEAEAALRGLQPDEAFWDAGERWIDAQCAARKQPPN